MLFGRIASLHTLSKFSRSRNLQEHISLVGGSCRGMSVYLTLAQVIRGAETHACIFSIGIEYVQEEFRNNCGQGMIRNLEP